MKNNTDNTNKYVVHYNKPFYVRLGTFLLIVFTALVIFMGTTLDWDRGALIFALCVYGFMAFWHLIIFLCGIYTKEYLFIFDETGITNNAVGAKWKFIPWEDVEDIEFYSSWGRDYIGIIVNDEEKYLKSVSRFRRAVAKQNKFFSDSLISVDLLLAKESPYEIEEGIIEQWKKHSGSKGTSGTKADKSVAEIQDIDETLQENAGYKGVWKIIIGMVLLNVGIFILNLYVSNHWIYGTPFSLRLIHDMGFSFFWMEDGYCDVSDLILDGPFYNVGTFEFGLITDAVMEGEIYRLFTHALFHADIIHLGMNMLSLVYISLVHFGRYGKREYFTWYFAGALGGGIFTVIVALITNQDIWSVGASSAIFGLLGGSLAPVIYSIAKVKSVGGSFRAADRRAMSEYIFFVLIMLAPGFFEENVSWEGHLGGLLGGLVAGLVFCHIKVKG